MTTDFAGLGLPAHLVRALDAAGFTTPTPIQEKSIPAQMAGQDVMGLAQTGSGKTAAFGLPLVAQLGAEQTKRQPKTVGALILAPTRELAVQIEDMIRTYARGSKLSTCLVLGGLSRQGQIKRLARGIDIVIATPGRLADLLDDHKIRLDQTRYLVLDEADRMLDMGFVKQVKQIAASTAKDRRTALFSATMAPEVLKLTRSLLNDPVQVEVSPQGTPVTAIEQQTLAVPTRQKRTHLNGLLADEALERVIVFARTKHGANRVAENLGKDGHDAAVIHGNKSQSARQSALTRFRDGKVRILVATDIAARGIDVPHISHVINYDLPDEAENYVHRIGRTGRNGADGVAISLIDPSEREKLRAIEKLMRRKLKAGEAPALGAQLSKADNDDGRTGRAENGNGRGKPRRPNSKASGHASGGNPGRRDDGQKDGTRKEGARKDGAHKDGAKKQRWSSRRKKSAKAGRNGGARPPRMGDASHAA